MLHGYCIRSAADPLPPEGLLGVDGAPVRVLANGSLAVWVSAAAAGPATVERLREHERVVRTALATATPLPLRFGSRFANDIEALGTLDRRRAEFEALLQRVAGRVEMGVRVRSTLAAPDPSNVTYAAPARNAEASAAAEVVPRTEMVRSRGHAERSEDAGSELAGDSPIAVGGDREGASAAGNDGSFGAGPVAGNSEVTESGDALGIGRAIRSGEAYGSGALRGGEAPRTIVAFRASEAQGGGRVTRAVEASGPRESSGVEPTGPGREYLMRRKLALEAQERARREAARILREIADFLAADRFPSTFTVVADGDLLGTVAHLVHRADFRHYKQRLAELRRSRPDLRLDGSGPWAPYSFV